MPEKEKKLPRPRDILIINIPTSSSSPLYDFLSSHEDAISPSCGKSCSEQIEYEISLRQNTHREIRYILYAGGPGLQEEAAVGDMRADDFLPLTIDNNVQVYMYASYQGLFNRQWAAVHGIHEGQFHGLKCPSYPGSAFLHISELLTLGITPEVAWLKHLVHCYTGTYLDKIHISKNRTLRQFLFRD